MEQRIEELIAHMTLEEKAAQMVQVPYNQVTREEALEWAKKGAGSFLHVLGDEARELQAAAVKSRLGVPVLFGIDAIHGHGLNDHATIFPSQLALACSWDLELCTEMGHVTAREVATDGLHWTFSPVLCLARDLRWGRVDETFGEDAVLSGELGAAVIKGYQGDDLSAPDSILACAKHYIGYGEAVGARDACDTEITFRKLKDIFVIPFRKAVEAGCATVMTAYGSVDGTPFTISRKAMKELLREELGFQGFVVTDWDNVASLVTKQYVCENLAEASKKSAEAGNDMIMTTTAFFEEVIRLVRDGKLKEKVIDDAVRHILTVKLRMGLFEQPEKKGIPGCIGCEEHLETAKEAARESIVLLKNNGILPLRNRKRIAVIGPNADDIKAQYGDWTYFTHPNFHEKKIPVRPYVTVLEGIRRIAEVEDTEISYIKGCGVLSERDDAVEQAVALAKECDTIVFVPGDNVALHGEFHDRANLELSGKQEELYLALRKTGIPLVTLLVTSKPLCIPKEAESDALVIAFNGGMFGGQAAAEVLFGRYNPCGRLPVSFPYHSGQLPVYYNCLPGWHGGKYVDFPAEPLFSFGEGLSYTKFHYENLRFSADSLLAEIDLTNAGDRTGSEVVQVYFRDVVSSVMTPVKKLIAFRRVTLAPGETRTIGFQLRREDFALVDEQERTVTEPGEFILMVGHSSKTEDLIQTGFYLNDQSDKSDL